MQENKNVAVSVIIPALNEESDLPTLLKALADQTFRDFEIILADAGSQDRTVELAHAAGARVVDGGLPGVGRNRGAEVARGDLLFFFDADVSFKPDFMQKIYDEMQKKYYDLATCEFKPQSDLRLDKVLFQMANLAVKVNQQLSPRAAGFCLFVSRRLFRLTGGFDESVTLAEDHDFVQRATKHRPLGFLDSAAMDVSIRRLEKEGRFSLIQKYAQVEMYLRTKGSIRDEKVVDYEFANFENKDDPARKKWLDDLESAVINLEKTYDQVAQSASRDDLTLTEKLGAVRDGLISLLPWQGQKK